MENNDNKLDILTKKIYEEGIEKAQHDANDILEKAKKDAENIIKEAEAKANSIIAKPTPTQQASNKRQKLN
jgi:V/A-type H+-transporting ATPase subunit E